MTITVYPVDAVAGIPNYTGQQLRQAFGIFAGPAPSGRPLGAFSGIRLGSPSNVVSATASTWTVRPHVGILDVETLITAGGYPYSNDANVTGSMSAANASNPRIDLISIQISDQAVGDGTTTPGAAVVYTTGTAATSPTVPATPARSMVLAQINVPTLGSGSPSTTIVAPFFTAAGGIAPVASTTYPTSPYVGQYVDDVLGGLMRWNGSLWVSYGRRASNVVTVSVTASSTTSQAVTFPANRFTVPPVVQVSAQTGNPSGRNVSYGGVTTTGFTVYAYSTATGTLNVSWTAVQDDA